jgi:iron complex outermembrane receptor protein
MFYHNAYESDDHYRDLISHAFGLPPSALPFPDQVADFDYFDYENERYNLELQYTSPHSGRWRAVVGTGIRLDRLKSEVLTTRNDWIDEWSKWLFGNVEYRASRHLLFNAGAMAENSNSFGSYLSPRLAVNWLFNDDHSIRASYARAKRKPSLLEDNINYLNRLDDGTPYFTRLSSTDLDHETVTALELGYIGYWLDHRLLIDLKLFREESDDLVNTVTDLSQQIPFGLNLLMNDGSTDVTGGELQAKYQTGPRDFISLQYARLNADIHRRGTINPTAYRNDNERSPPHPQDTASLLVSRGLRNNMEVSAGFYWISEMEWLGDGQDIDGYTRLDTRIAKKWRASGSRMQLEGIVQNIGGDYLTFRNENIFDTRAYLRFSLAFQ